MSSDDFYQCTLVEVMLAVTAFYEFHNNKDAAEWERTRMLAFYMIKPHDSKRRIKKPKDLFSLPHDHSHTEKSELREWLAARKAFDEEVNRQRWLAMNN